ncbi:MAG: hypothetical protein RLZZ09_810 [Pseudomonadota bacterium]
MTTHKTALYAAEAAARVHCADDFPTTYTALAEAIVTAYLAALGAEPVAWMVEIDGFIGFAATHHRALELFYGADPKVISPLYASPVVPGYVLVPEEPWGYALESSDGFREVYSAKDTAARRAEHGDTIITLYASVEPSSKASGGIRICPERDGQCPHGMNCQFWKDRYTCDLAGSRAMIAAAKEV